MMTFSWKSLQPKYANFGFRTFPIKVFSIFCLFLLIVTNDAAQGVVETAVGDMFVTIDRFLCVMAENPASNIQTDRKLSATCRVFETNLSITWSPRGLKTFEKKLQRSILVMSSEANLVVLASPVGNVFWAHWTPSRHWLSNHLRDRRRDSFLCSATIQQCACPCWIP